MKTLFATLMIALLAGCAGTGPRIDTSLSAKAQSSRVKFVVLHYTVSDLPQSIKILTQQGVSAHYLLTDEQQPRAYNLVDENRASRTTPAYRTGRTTRCSTAARSASRSSTPASPVGADGVRTWYPFPQAQIDQLILLLKQIVAGTISRPRTSSATATSRRAASRIRGRCSRGSSWRRPAW